MADRVTSTEENNNLLPTLFSKMAIEVLREQVAFYRLARKYPMPAGNGVTMKISGWRPIAGASSYLSQHSTSANIPVNLSSRTVTITLSAVGRAVAVTDLAEMVSVISPVAGAQGELLQSAALSLDNVIQLAVYKNVLGQVGKNTDTKSKLLSAWLAAQASSFNATTTAETGTRNGGSAIARDKWFGFPVVFASSATRLSSVGVCTVSSMAGPIGIRKAVYKLHRNAAKPFSSGRFVAPCHPNFIRDLFSNPDYKQYITASYDGPKETMIPDTASLVHGVELVMSQNAPRYATSAFSATPLAIIGDGALAVSELAGGIEFIVQEPTDPFHLKKYLSYKLRAGAAVLNTSAGVLLICKEKSV